MVILGLLKVNCRAKFKWDTPFSWLHFFSIIVYQQSDVSVLYIRLSTNTRLRNPKLGFWTILMYAICNYLLHIQVKVTSARRFESSGSSDRYVIEGAHKPGDRNPSVLSWGVIPNTSANVNVPCEDRQFGRGYPYPIVLKTIRMLALHSPCYSAYSERANIMAKG